MTSWDSLSSHQKLSLGVFIVIGLSTIILGVFRLNKAIALPFRRTGNFTFKTSDQLEKERTQKLREQDTDGDGLNDYDELYVFRTSPFLEDSDSDGIPDGAEVAQESDPNCPKGKTCRQAKIFAASNPGATQQPSADQGAGTNPATGQQGQPTTSTSAGAEEKVMAVIAETFGDPNQLTPEKIADGLKKMSPNELRAFLGKLGVPAQALQRADDATLRKLITDTLNEITVSPPPGTSVNAPSSPPGGTGTVNAPAN
ncbi:MAG: hypothetical protein RL272_1199 [Candidatus Parcubacteria bacterium]